MPTEQDKTKFDSGYIEWVKQVLKKDYQTVSLIQRYGIQKIRTTCNKP